MNQINTKLDRARKRQKRIHFVAGLTVAVSLLFVAAIVASRGTRIDILPEEAKEQAEITVSTGLGFSLGSTVYSLFGNPVISVFAPGFKNTQAIIDPAHLGKVFSLELAELPGRLVIEGSGDSVKLLETVWLINGRETARSAGLDIELEAGSYIVTIDNPFYEEKELNVEIARGKLTRHQVELLPVKGGLSLASTPSGAAVFLDDKEVGRTPLRLDRDGGPYSLRLVTDKFIDTIEQLYVTRKNPEVIRNYQLEAEKAKLSVELRPEDGTLMVNGIKAVSPLFLDITKEHKLSYMKAGFYTEHQTVRLDEALERHISFQLKEEVGDLVVSSSPPANVLIDTRDYGLSPVSISLPAIDHTITFQKSGFRSVSIKVRPEGDTVQRVSATLLTEYQARLQEAPREYTNSAGIKLKLFIINDNFSMGAPRSEKGQRANEFLHQVSLSKPFYASLHEITNSQIGQMSRFAKFIKQKANNSTDIPVTMVSWQEATDYCNWLSAKEKFQPFYTIVNGRVAGFNPHSDGYRLLSEAEWEWLARKAGKKQQTRFGWGDDTVIPPKAANVADESAKGKVKIYVPNYTDGYPVIAPVGSLVKEPSGLYDIAGNVSEWVHDVYSIVPPLKNSIASNPLGEQLGNSHVVKGGNFRSGTITTLRPAFREGLSNGRDDVGFRIGRYLYGGDSEKND